MISLARRVGRRRLAREEEGARRHVQLRVVAQAIVENNHVKNIQQLSFVFMNALHLAVEDGIGVDGQPGGHAQPRGESRLGRPLGRAEAFQEGSVIGQGRDLLELGRDRMIQPSPIALREEPGQIGVRQEQPAPGRHAVGLVVEPLREDLGQVGDDGLA